MSNRNSILIGGVIKTVATVIAFLSTDVRPTICIGENKGADQLRSNCEADQRLCFSRFKDSSISKIFSL